MLQDASRWALLYNQTPLCDVPRHFAGMRQSPFLLQYLTTVLSLCPVGGRTLETGVGSGYGAIWLSLRGVQASGIDYSPAIVERARQVNNVLCGSATISRDGGCGASIPATPLLACSRTVISSSILACIRGHR